jgi:hypothetical protein
MLLHQNLCEDAYDLGQLYKLWDDDLKDIRRKKEYYRWFGLFLLGVSYAVWVWKGFGGYEIAYLFLVIAAIEALLASIKISVDESNVNYLMHHWDLQVALDRIRSENKHSSLV